MIFDDIGFANYARKGQHWSYIWGNINFTLVITGVDKSVIAYKIISSRNKVIKAGTAGKFFIQDLKGIDFNWFLRKDVGLL